MNLREGPPRAGWLETIIGWALAVLILIASLFDFVPFAPSLPVANLDYSWEFALNAALAKGLVFGRDIIFTFGPYAPVYTRMYAPATDIQMLWSSGIIAVAFALTLICLTKGASRLIGLGLSIFLVLIWQDAQFYGLALASLLLICRTAMPAGYPDRIAITPGVTLTLALLIVALGLLALVKGGFALSSGFIILLGFIVHYIRGRKSAAIAGLALFAAAIIAFWIIAGQPVLWLPVFFLSQLPVITGYAGAMSASGPVGPLWVFGICCLALGILGAPSLRTTGAAGKCMAAGSFAILFLAFKEGFIRNDGHAIIAGGMLGVAGWVMLLGRQGKLQFAGLAIALAGWAIINQSAIGITNDMLAGLQFNRIALTLSRDVWQPYAIAETGLVSRMQHPDAMRQEFAADLIALQAQQPLPKLAGTADIYSYDQSALLATGMDWDPRPLIQSYTAYTPSLERADADHLASPKAPANIFFSLQPIDGNLPALEDGASWPALLTRYGITGWNPQMVFLKLRAASAAADPTAGKPSFEGDFRLGERVPLPQTPAFLWAQVNFKQTLLGKVEAVIFKPPLLRITYFFPDGTQREFRYIAGMGEAGFLVAPLVQNSAGFAALTLPNAADYLAESRPTAIRITADHGRGLWRSSFSLRFFPLNVPAQPNVTNLLFSPLKTEPNQVSAFTTNDCSYDIINDQYASHWPVILRDYIQLAGWAAISGKDGTAPDWTDVTLTASDGTTFSFPSKQVARPDVNAHFSAPNMGPVGYTAAGQLLGLSGNYMLGLKLRRGGEIWTCSKRLPVHIENTQPANR